jgi:AcrR family transcriptional regulator
MDPRVNILAAAQRTFARHGFRHTSMAMVAEEADLSRQALYHHFASKEDLFAALVETLQTAAIDAALAAQKAQARAALPVALHATLFAYHRSLSGSVEGSAYASELLDESMKHCADVVSAHARKLDAQLKQMVREAVKSGTFVLADGISADELVGLVLMGAKGIKLAHAQGPERAHELALKKMIDVLCSGAGRSVAAASLSTRNSIKTARRVAR